MAAPQTVPNTPLSNRYHNDEDATESRAYRLPGGGCNWTNLSLGANAPKCGCKRFWDKSLGTPSINGGLGKTGFCMCEHHACYHDLDQEGGRGPGEVVVEGRSATPRPLTARQTPQILGPDRLQDENLEVGRPLQEATLPDTMQWSRYIQSGSSQGLPAIPSQCLLPSDNGSLTSGSQTGYARPFGGLGLGTLNHITRTNAGIPANSRLQADNPRMQIYEDAHGNAYLQSLTEVATPSARASQDPEVDFGRHVASVHNALETIAEGQPQSAVALRTVTKEPESQVPIKQSGSNPGPGSLAVPTDTHDGKQLVLHSKNMANNIADYPDIKDHERRIDLLENASFSNAAIEELQEADEHMDTRVGELEGRVDELEKAQAAQNDAVSIGSRQNIEGSFDSRISNSSSAMIAAAMDHIDPARVEALEAQVAELQAVAPPSHSRPWEVEVVFLPFGSSLMGIWSSQQTMTQRSRLGSTVTDDWTQTQHNSMALAQACLTAHDQATAWERSATNLEYEDSTWLMAKACGLRSRVDQRLRSRGLVRMIQICGPDARDVQAAMLTAFGDLPSILTEDPFGSQDENIGAIPRSLRKYIGLQAPWMPLRKLHKDSCLRFLNPSEMVTPALWTVPFLSSSVAMRQTGIRRLYVTQRDSYVQHLGESTANWTWQKLRQLPRVYPEQTSFTHTPEADAQEACWAYDPRLDPPPQSMNSSLHSSFASHISSLSIESVPGSPHLGHDPNIEPASPSDHFSSAAVSPTTSTPRTSIAPHLPPLSPLKERNPFRPIHIRTTSMPSFIPLKDQPGFSSLQHATTSKRRIASFEQETQSSPTGIASASAQNIRSLEFKRRRISRSPSRPRDTPRWSVGPPSPYPFLEDVERKRGTTPFAYATPHSNAPYVPRSVVDVYEDDDDEERGSTTDDFNADADEGYEQNALSDYEDEQGSVDLGRLVTPDDEWEGVQDEAGMAGYDSRIVGKEATLVGLRHSDHGYNDAQTEQDKASELSSQPSEYPSTQPEATTKKKSVGLFERRQRKVKGVDLGFRIHVDE